MSATPIPTEQPFPASEIIAGSDDLLSEILSHLPVKPLLRFKSVSKQFLSLISHPRFSLLHSRRHPYHPSSALFFLHHHRLLHHSPPPPSSAFEFIPLSPTTTTTTTTPPPFFSLLKSFPIDILQSCNGLLLCSNVRIFNPTTNQLASHFSPRKLVLGFSLAFDPSSSDHYRIVCVWEVEEKSFSIDVYSSETHQWRPVVSLFTAPFDVEFERGVYWNGRVHWLSHTDSTVVFNLEKECVESLDLPKSIEGVYIERFRYFGESCGHLHLIEIRTNCVAEFEVLELERETMEWFVKYRVEVDVLGRGFEAEMFQDHSDRFNIGLFRFYAFSVLALVRAGAGAGDGDEDDDDDCGGSKLVVSVPGKVISYNFKTKASSLISNVVDDSDTWLPFKGYNAYQFIESLYCP